MTRTTKVSLFPMAGLLVSLASCGGPVSQHDVNEKFYLITSNTKVPYWQNEIGRASCRERV